MKSLIGFLITIFVLIGIICVGLADWREDWKLGAVILRDVGISFLVAGLIGIFDVFLKQHLFAELDRRAKIDQTLVSSGVQGVYPEIASLDWKTLLKHTTHFDLIAFRTRTWRQNHREPLKAMLKRKNSRVRIFLPNPENQTLVADLANRFSMEPTEVTGSIFEAVKEFRAMLPTGSSGGTLELFYFDRSLTYTLFAFDHDVIVTMYSYTKERFELPALHYRDGASKTRILKDLENLRALSKSVP